MKLLYEPTAPTDLLRAGPGPLGDDNPRTTGGPPFPVATTFNPLTSFTTPPVHGVWASDPLWTPPADGGAVSSWRNGGSVGGDLTQATGSKQPTYRASTAAFNNKPTVQSDGTDDALAVTYAASISQPVYIVAVSSIDTASRYLFDGPPGGSRMMLFTPTTKYRLHAGVDLTSAGDASASPQMLFITYNGVSSSLDVNGTNVLTGNPGSNVMGGLTFFNRHTDLGGSAAALHLAYFAVFTTNPTALPEWTAFKAWCLSFYGITVA